MMCDLLDIMNDGGPVHWYTAPSHIVGFRLCERHARLGTDVWKLDRAWDERWPPDGICDACAYDSRLSRDGPWAAYPTPRYLGDR